MVYNPLAFQLRNTLMRIQCMISTWVTPSHKAMKRMHVSKRPRLAHTMRQFMALLPFPSTFLAPFHTMKSFNSKTWHFRASSLERVFTRFSTTSSWKGVRRRGIFRGSGSVGSAIPGTNPKEDPGRVQTATQANQNACGVLHCTHRKKYSMRTQAHTDIISICILYILYVMLCKDFLPDLSSWQIHCWHPKASGVAWIEPKGFIANPDSEVELESQQKLAFDFVQKKLLWQKKVGRATISGPFEGPGIYIMNTTLFIFVNSSNCFIPGYRLPFWAFQTPWISGWQVAHQQRVAQQWGFRHVDWGEHPRSKENGFLWKCWVNLPNDS